ncbi:MAG TPA: ABC transporter, partial [Clostridiales bacterium]|nr:ABC transporter [Clostridiales bacterium]
MILSAEKISKNYSERTLFNEISFSIHEGERVGLIGANSTGKTTLLRILAQIEPYDAGNIIYSNDIKIEYLPQNPDFIDGTTVLEQIFKGNSPVMKLMREYEDAQERIRENPNDEECAKKLIELTQRMDSLDAWSIEFEAKSILTKLGVTDFRADVSKLSGGQRKRIAIASALITPADLLILDEPTNHIDHDAAEWLENYLNKRKGALLMVTHDRYLLDRAVNRMIELEGGKLYSYQANYSNYLELKAHREELVEASQRKRQNLIRRELEWIKRGAKARSTKQKARIDRFEKLTEQQETIENTDIEMKISFSRLGKKIIEVENVNKAFPCGEIIKNFSYTMLREDRIGIVGP